MEQADDSVFHEGEVSLQELFGERPMARQNGHGIQRRVHDAARRFVAERTWLAVGGADEDDRVWASLWSGPAGFIAFADATTVVVRQARGSDGPLERSLRPGMSLGSLAVDFARRRRFRINAVVAAVTEDHVRLAVREAYANCPKYLQRRELVAAAPGPRTASTAAFGVELGSAQCDAIARADTLFVASTHPRRGSDVSHRGGYPGFVRALDARTLRFPDYPGNSMFNTLGNFAVHPAGGLLVPDFATGRLLALTGSVSLGPAGEEPAQPTGGTGRYWEFRVEGWRETASPLRADAAIVDFSPFNPARTAD